MKIKDVMTTNPTYIASTASIQEAAQKMAELDCGFLPVGENEKLIGTITDRDIAIRATAKGVAATAAVKQIMSPKVYYCTETDSLESVAQNMAENQTRRMVVLNNTTDKKFVGVIAIADLVKAQSFTSNAAQALFKAVSQNNNSTSASHVA
jgi:CBS domain-containing protein